MSPKSRPRASQESAIYTLPLQVSCLLEDSKHLANEGRDVCLGFSGELYSVLLYSSPLYAMILLSPSSVLATDPESGAKPTVPVPRGGDRILRRT